MKRPVCFISYSHDSREHAKWVGRLAKQIETRGIDVRLDKSCNKLGDDLLNFMLNGLKDADKVLMICTPKYYAKLKGGAAFEKMLVGGQLSKDAWSNKYIPILKEGDEESSIPDFLRTKKRQEMRGKNIKSAALKEIISAIKKTEKPKPKVNRMKKHKGTPSPESKRSTVEMVAADDISDIKLHGYTLLSGRGADGIRYLWKRSSDGAMTESMAFNRRLKAYEISDQDKKISAYTTSVSFGCALSQKKAACSFCATGRLPFKGALSANEIALQNIFMALYDSQCPSWTEVHDHSREFAFMGQGEPGLSYTQVRQAILLTDAAMKSIGQKVHRYIFSTAGIIDSIDSFLHDLRSGVFKNKVTLHFSLHAVGGQRSAIMPINRTNPYSDFLKKTIDVAKATGEKVAIGVLLFENFSSKDASATGLSVNRKNLGEILQQLHPDHHRVDLCDVNINAAIKEQSEVSNEKARQLLEFVQAKGFEVKLFSSFGTDKESGCGMLAASKADVQPLGTTTVKNYNNAIALLREVLVIK